MTDLGLKRTDINKILFLVAFWVFAAILIIFFETAAKKSTGVDYPLSSAFFYGVLVTIGSGIPMAAFEVLFFNKLLRKRPFGTSLLLKTAFYLACIIIFTSVAVILIKVSETGKSFHDTEVVSELVKYLTSLELLSVIAFWGSTVLLSLFILQVTEKFGQEVLGDFLLGKYHHPREVSRIFMFLDLKSSTRYAELLGHIRYSQFIQDCFFDLTDTVEKNQAQIYQYVGDEAVLTWKMKVGKKHNNCLHTFFDFDRVIKNKKDYYQNKYGIIPEFKAGLDGGVVTAAEVGVIKKELAYHGDVLNTASRIMGKCNEFNSNFLISEKLMNELRTIKDGIDFELVGDIELKGKELPVTIYKVTEHYSLKT